MYTLALDLSLNNTGFALLKNNNLLVFGNINNKKLEKETEKLVNIFNFLDLLIQQTDIVKIESAFASRNVKTLQKLMLVHGIALYLCGKYNKQYTYYTPAAWRKQFLGSYNKKFDIKKLVEAEVKKLYPILNNFKITDDVTDAIAIALCK